MEKQRYDEILSETIETMDQLNDHEVAEWIADLVWQLERIANLTSPFLVEDQNNG